MAFPRFALRRPVVFDSPPPNFVLPFDLFAASPELAALLRRLKTIYAITGGKVEAGPGGKMDFNAKKSVLITKLHEFDSVSVLARRSAQRTRAKAAAFNPLPAYARAKGRGPRKFPLTFGGR